MSVIGPVLSAAPVNQSSIPGSNEPWENPRNLSASGAASDPQIVFDSDGDLHILWREDTVNSFYYALKKDGRWYRPVALELPFATHFYAEDQVVDENELVRLYDPQLIADGDGQIHAFWLDKDDMLYHSAVPAGEVDTFESWSEREKVGESVLGFTAATDDANQIHLSYVVNVDSPEAPAGVYYRRRNVGEDNEGDSISWSEPATLYQSAYFRSMEPEDVNLQLATGSSAGNESSVYVAFDNRPLEEVFFVRSSNGGTSWQSPSIIDKRLPEDMLLSVGPSNIDLITTAEDLQVAWIAGHDAICQIYHQRSEDDGRTWLPVNVIETNDEACPMDLRLLDGVEDLQFLLSGSDEGALLQAWNGEEWSKQEKQDILASFDDPVTHREVSLNCQQTVVNSDNELLVLGCGSSEGNDDIWLLERALGSEEEWFSLEPSIWSEPASLMATSERLADPLLLHGSDDLLHAFWIFNDVDAVAAENASLYYSSLSDDSWSRQIPLRQLDTKQADQLTGIFDQDNGPFLLWRDADTNSFYYSFVMSDRILIPTEWSIPQPLFEPNALIIHPIPYLGIDGTVHVIYSVPLNEGRGIYLIGTSDLGNTWSEPTMVVDASVGDWAMIDRPSITQTENGNLHVVFTVYSLEPEAVAEALYYTHSDDEGKTWSEPQMITEGDISWSQVVGIGSQAVLIAWQKREDDQFQLWSQQTSDGGANWELPQLILTPDPQPGVFSLIDQVPNQPYLVQIMADSNGRLTLEERRWNDNVWRAAEFYDLETGLEDEQLLDLSATVTENGRLVTIFNTEPTVQQGQDIASGFTVVRPLSDQQLIAAQLAGEVPASNLLFTQRSVEVPAYITSGGPSEETSIVSADSAAQSAAPAPNPDTSQDENATSSRFDLGEATETGDSTPLVNQVVMGFAPAGIIVVIILAAGIIRLRPKR